MCERDAKRPVNAVIVSQTFRDDQEEWIQNNHLNLSSLVQEKLDELIEKRES